MMSVTDLHHESVVSENCADVPRDDVLRIGETWHDPHICRDRLHIGEVAFSAAQVEHCIVTLVMCGEQASKIGIPQKAQVARRAKRLVLGSVHYDWRACCRVAEPSAEAISGRTAAVPDGQNPLDPRK